MWDKFRDPVSGFTHLGGAVLAAVGMVILLALGHESVPKIVSLTVYGLTLVAMFSASATYHLVKSRPEVIKVLRKFDHSAIYLLIAGTYTPICLNLFHGFWQWGLLVIVWSMAAIGIGVKIFIINAPRWVTAGIYLVMGWLAVLAFGEILRVMPVGAVIWLVAGGLFFTLGAVVYITKKPDFFPGVFGFHEIWHIFVLLGCVCHYILIAVFVASAGALA